MHCCRARVWLPSNSFFLLQRDTKVMQEVQSFLKFVGEVYAVFGLDYTMALSTRPEGGYLGELESWNRCGNLNFSLRTFQLH